MKKILIIDDDQDISYIVEMVLSVSYDTMIVSNASRIISVYQQFLPDLMIIDNFIAQRTAIDVVKELKLSSGGETAPYILFSAASNIAQLASDIEASAFLPKPFHLSDLSLVVDRVLREHAERRGASQLSK